MQTCLELGFSYSDDEWRELRQTLAKKSGVDVETDLRVRNGDFFAALNGVAKKGGKTFNDRSHEEAKKPEKHLKVGPRHSRWRNPRPECNSNKVEREI